MTTTQRGKKKAAAISRSNTEIRAIVLRYFYDRNAASTSVRGKKGYAVKISDVRKETFGFGDQNVQRILSV